MECDRCSDTALPTDIASAKSLQCTPHDNRAEEVLRERGTYAFIRFAELLPAPDGCLSFRRPHGRCTRPFDPVATAGELSCEGSKRDVTYALTHFGLAGVPVFWYYPIALSNPALMDLPPGGTDSHPVSTKRGGSEPTGPSSVAIFPPINWLRSDRWLRCSCARTDHPR